MKRRIWIIGIIFVLLIGYFVYRFNRFGEAAMEDFSEDCIQVPDTFKRWQQFAKTNWGGYASSLKKHLGIDQEDKDQRALAAGFFKAIDVEPRSEYVKYYRRHLRAWMKSDQALPHWDIEKGHLRCK